MEDFSAPREGANINAPDFVYEKGKSAPWRRSWGEVAPMVEQPVPTSTQRSEPEQQAPHYVSPWSRERSAPNSQRQQFIPTDAGSPPSPQPQTKNLNDYVAPSQSTDYGSSVSAETPSWRDYTGDEARRRTLLQPQEQGTAKLTSENSLPPTTSKQDQIIEESLRAKTSVSGFLYTGSITGGLLHYGMHMADQSLMNKAPDAYNFWQERWATASPTLKYLQVHFDKVSEAEGAFSSAETQSLRTKRELNKAYEIPEAYLADARAKLANTKKGSAEMLKIAMAQLEFLKSLDCDTKGGELRAAIGSKSKLGCNGIVFDSTSALGKRMRFYASSIDNGCYPHEGIRSELSALTSKVSLLAKSNSERIRLENLVQFFEEGKAGVPRAIEEATGDLAEVKANSKIFLHNSKEVEHLLEYATRSNAHAESIQRLEVAKKVLLEQNSHLEVAQKNAVNGAHGSVAESIARGAAKGLALSAASLAIGFGTDSLIGQSLHYQPKQDGIGRFLLDGAITPGIVLSKLPNRLKAGWGALSFGAARAVDIFSGTGPSVEMSTVLRPNTLDAVVIPAMMLAPLHWQTQAKGIVAGLALGRGYNLFANATGLDGNTVLKTREQASEMQDKDAFSQTERTFLEAADKAAELALENHAVVEKQLSDAFDRGSLHPVQRERAIALLSLAVGTARLKLGSRLSVSDHSPDAYFLKGMKYDFGGTASEQLLSALTSLETMKRYTQDHIGETNNTVKLDSKYIGQIEKLQGIVEQRIEEVYKEQDIDRVFGAVKEMCAKDTAKIYAFMKEAELKLSSLGPNLSKNDVRYAAKMARDLAIVNLAYADSCRQINRSEASSFLDGAQVHIANSEALTQGNASDTHALAKVKRLYDLLKARI